MKNVLKLVLAPIASLIIYMVACGLFMTFCSLRLKLGNTSTEMIGYVTAAFFAGLVFGSLRIHRLIERIGHIRAFSSFASLTTVCVMIQTIYFIPWVWILMRFCYGFFLAGLFITIESWLLANSSKKTKGKILSIYMIAFYGAQVIGQYFLKLSDPLSIIPYAITIGLSSFSIIPICLTKQAAPIIQEPSYLNVFHLIKIAPLGVLGSILAGFMLGAVYGLLPVFTQDIGLGVDGVAQIMALIIFGGLILQWPMGHLSDKIDRRKVMLIISISTCIITIIIALTPVTSVFLLKLLIWMFGGFIYTIYPLSISHTSDLVESKDFTAASGALNLVYGIGAILGPIIASYVMSFFSYRALFFYFTAIGIILTIVTIWRTIKSTPVPIEEKEPYSNVPPLASELDPRVNSNDNNNHEQNKS